MQLLVLIVIVYCVCGTRTSEEFSERDGANGLLPTCPGSEKPSRIPKRRLDELQFVVEGKSRNRYPYSKAVQGIANDPNIDFKNKDTVIFVSGWLDFTSSPIMVAMGAAYAKLNKNVILLETSSFTSFEYPIAARLSREVGRRTAFVLADLLKYGFNPKKTHIIGLSLGGQVVSFVAKNFRSITGKSIDRLTAIDPAGPCFRKLSPEHRLNASDADHVDVVHTNIDGLGMATPVGHVDFYINGGEFQPSATPSIPCLTLCSHVRGHFLWLAALDHPNSFMALRCNSVQEAREENCYNTTPLVTNVMGPNTDFSKPGIFYLATSNKSPYYLGVKGLKEEFNPTMSHITELNKGDIKL